MHHYIPSLFLGLLFLFANLGFAKSEEFKADELGRICGVDHNSGRGVIAS